MIENHVRELPKAVKEIDQFVQEYLYHMDARVPQKWFDLKRAYG